MTSATDTPAPTRTGITKTVGIMLYPGCTLLDFAGATQVFTEWASGWKTEWLSPDPAVPDQPFAPITTSEGLSVVPSASIHSPPDMGVVFVPGGGGDAVASAMASADYMTFLKAQGARQDTWVGAVCVGTFIVAAAGLLKNCMATTHWRLADELRRMARMPDYAMKVPQGFPRYVLDRPRRRFSGGGVSASIDLALELVKELDSPSRRKSLNTANAAALAIQYEPLLPEGIGRGNPRDHRLDGITNALTQQMTKGLADPITAAVDAL